MSITSTPLPDQHGPAARGRKATRRSRTPYGWLGAGALGVGVWAALAGGAGVAHADATATDSTSASVSGHAQNRGAVNRPVQRSSVSGGDAVPSVGPAAARASAALPARAVVGARLAGVARPQRAASNVSAPVTAPAASSTVEAPTVSQGSSRSVAQSSARTAAPAVRGQAVRVSAEEINTNVASLNAVQWINRFTRSAQNWIWSLPASPIRNVLQDGLVFGRHTALSLLGVRVAATPSCVSGGNCSGQDFSGQDLRGLYAPGVNFTEARFKETRLEYAYLTGASLNGADLAKANLYVAELHGAYLGGADLANASLNGASLYYASLPGASLYRASLYGANLYLADLTNADLTGARLPYADLTYTSLTGANLSYADLTDAFNLANAGDLSGVTWYKTICPNGTVTNTGCTA